MKRANIKSIEFNKKTLNVTSNPIEGGTFTRLEFTDGIIQEAINLKDIVITKFNKPIEISESGEVTFLETDSANSIPANTEIKISAEKGLEII